MTDQWPIFIFSYRMDGSEWEFSLPAKDFDDAQRRLAAIAMTGRLDGQSVETVDARTPIWVRILLWMGLAKTSRH